MERKGIMLVKKLKETFEQYDQKEVVLQGWVRTNRKSKALGFIELNDGSCFSNVQIVYTDALNNFDVSEDVKKKVFERREREKIRFGL